MSTEEAAFLRTLVAHPDDEVARLVFADWLEERNDPRAGWLRDPELWERIRPDVGRWLAPDARGTVPALIALLAPNEWPHRLLALDLLQKLGSPAIPAVRAWTRETPDDRFFDNQFVLRANPPPELPPVAELIERTRSDNWYECWEAATDLGFHGPAAALAVPALIALSERDWDVLRWLDEDPVQRATFDALAAIGPGAVAAIPRLVRALGYDRDDEATVQSAAEALRAIGTAGAEALLENVEAADDETGCRWALDILTELHPDPVRALGRVVLAGGAYTAGIAAELLGKMGAAAAPAVPMLIEALRQPLTAYGTPHASIANALGKIAGPAQAAMPALRELLAACQQSSPNDWYIRNAVAAALARLGDPGAGLPAILAELALPDPNRRCRAVATLGVIAEEAPNALPHLLNLFTDPSEYVRREAASAIAGPLIRLDVPTRFIRPLLDALADPAASVREAAAKSVGKVKAARPGAFRSPTEDLDGRFVEALCGCLADPVPQVPSAAIQALTAWESLPPSAVEPLRRSLGNCEYQDVSRTIEALVRVSGPLPADLIPLMVRWFASSDPAIAEPANRALVKIGAPAIAVLAGALRRVGRIPGVREHRQDVDEPEYPERVIRSAIRALFWADALEDAVRSCDAAALGQLAPVFRKLLGDEDATTREAAAAALRAAGEEASH